MDEMVLEVVEYLCHKYGMCAEEAYSIVYNEWEYVEEMTVGLSHEKKIPQKIAKSLIELYMVA